MGIEPTLAAWEAAVLPLNYTRGGRPIVLAGTRGGQSRARHLGSEWVVNAAEYGGPALPEADVDVADHMRTRDAARSEPYGAMQA
jgi:hypothetical protein